MTQQEMVMAAVESGAKRLADLATISFVFGGDTVKKLVRADQEPEKNTPEWYVWANKTGCDWVWQTLTPSQAEPILDRSLLQELEQAKIRHKLLEQSIRFRAANPVIPMDKGGLEALLAADRR